MRTALYTLVALTFACILTAAYATSTGADSPGPPASVATVDLGLPLQEHRYALANEITPQVVYGNTVGRSVATGPKCSAAPCTMSRPASADPQINPDLAIWTIDTVAGLEALDLRTFRYVRLEDNTTNRTLNWVASAPHLGSGRRVIWEETQLPSSSATFKYWLVVVDVA